MKSQSKAAPSSAGFQRAYEAGTRDPDGQFMGGTEMFTLATHAGKLWAATGYYWDLPGKDPSPGAQVLVLDRPGGTWRVSRQFDSKEWRTSLDAVTFTTDGKGEKLAHPVSMLVAVPTNPDGNLVVHVRDEKSGTWTTAPLATGGKIVSARSAFVHRDRVTGVDRVLVAAYPNGMFSGVYDPAAPTRIRWEQAPELTGYDRPMGFAECNGSVYLTAKNLYRRVDGESPRWEKVFSFDEKILKPGVGMRGLAAIPNPQGPGEILLIAADGNPAKILRIDPALNYKATEELDVLDLLARQWGRRPSAAVPAYNGMTPVTDPRTGETVHLLGLAANFSAAASAEEYPKEGWERGGWYLIRHADGRYEMRQILDESKPRLIATREIKVSPFGDRTLYFAGYNPNTNLSHNTAWIYSAPVAVALAPQRPATEEPPVVAIMKIQGSGETSPWKGRMVRTTGVVTQVAANRAGFWIQDPAGDGDPKTSDGLYVSAAGLPPDAVFPEVKDAVRVTGEADEGSKKDDLQRTRLRDVSRIEVLAKGKPLPEPVVLSHVPAAADIAGQAAWEALEGMRVRVEDAAAKLVGVVDYASGSYRVEPGASEVVSLEAPAGTP